MGSQSGQREKDPRRQLQGIKSREEGAMFEEWLKGGCEIYKRQGIALVEKTPEPMAPIKRLEENRFIAVFTQKAQGDFKGTLAGGRSVAFEAKHTSTTALSPRVVTPKQKEWLEMHHQLGALCFVMVSIQGQRFYRVPWCFWRGLVENFTELAEVELFAVPLRAEMGILGVMFLHDLHELEEDK